MKFIVFCPLWDMISKDCNHFLKSVLLCNPWDKKANILTLGTFPTFVHVLHVYIIHANNYTKEVDFSSIGGPQLVT